MRNDGRCFHCGEVIGLRPVHEEDRVFCCSGCASASAWIRSANLQDYYRLRTRNPEKVGEELGDFSAWDRDSVQHGHVHARPDGTCEITVLTDGMHCAACAWLIDNALRREDGVEEVVANAVTGRVRVRWREGDTRLSQLLARMATLGYRPYLATGTEREAARLRDRNRWILRIGLAGLGAMQAMMFAEALYLDTKGEMPLATRDFFRWITFLVSTPVVFWAGWPFIAGMWREWRGKRLGMDTLIAGSSILAWAASTIETVRGGVHVWYDAAVMFVFLLLAARMIEQSARKAASAQVDALARARPLLATREQGDAREQVSVAELVPGDIVRVSPGEPAPADGILLEAAAFDESLLTGESRAVAKQAGDTVYAGSLCAEQPARVRVSRTGSDTRLSELARLVDDAQAQRPPLAQKADRIAHWFVILLLLSAAVVYAWWRMHNPARAFEVLLAVLVVSCPCALSLAIPSALAAAHGALSKMGVLGVRADALERLAHVDRIVFDKTGTLTDGQPRIGEVNTFGDISELQAERVAAALERDSRHPLARAFHAFDDGALQATEVRQQPGQGIEGVVDGAHWRLGTRAFATQETGEDDGALWLSRAGIAQARFVMREQRRDDAVSAVQALRETGIEPLLFSGDGEAAVARIANETGIATHRSRMQPEEKLEAVRALQAEGHRVAMVGDGINDAPVLAGADVSLAMGEGAALAQRAADLVIASPQLARVPQAIALAKKTQRVVRQNLLWAALYNVIALPLAATGLVTPWVAALGMALSSLLVTLNALRLTRGVRA